MAFIDHFYFYLWDSDWGGAFCSHTLRHSFGMRIYQATGDLL